jgi:hypothetical protein
MNMSTKATAEWKPETPGKQYAFTCYALWSRKVGDSGAWYGRDNYRTLEEAKAALREVTRGGRYQDIGGITVDFGPDDGTRMERKIVRVIKQCEVLEVVVGPA